MSRAAVARTYAETMLELAARQDAEDSWLEMLAEVSALYTSSAVFKAFLHSPAVTEADKRRVLRGAFEGRYPEMFLRFVLVVLQKRRQGLLPEMETACRDALYESTGRMHAAVTLTAEPDADFRAEIEKQLSRVLDRGVDADFRVDERLIGGMVVRVQDRVLDGSVRRRLQTLRRSLLDQRTS